MNPCIKHEAQETRESGSGFKCYLCEIERLRAIESAARELTDSITVRPFEPNATSISASIRSNHALNRLVQLLSPQEQGSD